jgi:hypothetical protein
MMSEDKPVCPICGKSDVHHVREYVIKGQPVRLAFSDCLHTPEEVKAAKAKVQTKEAN